MTGIRSYFIDESGDGVLFDSRGRSQLSRSGCLQNFYLGLADVQDADALTTDLDWSTPSSAGLSMSLGLLMIGTAFVAGQRMLAAMDGSRGLGHHVAQRSSAR